MMRDFMTVPYKLKISRVNQEIGTLSFGILLTSLRHE
jgi:hypothetical protein